MNIAAVKSFFIALTFCLTQTLPVRAATVSLIVIETGAAEETAAEKNGRETLESWETGMMNVFFEAGHIVSNAPAVRLLQPPDGDMPPEARREFDEADSGGADYFIVLRLDYGAETEKPDQISLELYKIHPRGLIYGKNYVPALAGNFPTAVTLARTLIPYIRGN
jgi:hypothetical protein